MSRLNEARPTRRLLLGSLALLLLAIPAGIMWQCWAEPPYWENTEAGPVLTQQAASGQFGVEVRFIAVGVILCAIWGAVLGATCKCLGWVLVSASVVTALLASAIAWRVGVTLGPPAPERGAELAVGQRFPDQLGVASPGAFVLWAAAAVGGVLLALVLSGQQRSGQQRSGQQRFNPHPASDPQTDSGRAQNQPDRTGAVAGQVPGPDASDESISRD